MFNRDAPRIGHWIWLSSLYCWFVSFIMLSNVQLHNGKDRFVVLEISERFSNWSEFLLLLSESIDKVRIDLFLRRVQATLALRSLPPWLFCHCNIVVKRRKLPELLRCAVECYSSLLIPVICSNPQFIFLHIHSCCHISLF